jgi:thiol:disulfide interchange protein DsbD
LRLDSDPRIVYRRRVRSSLVIVGLVAACGGSPQPVPERTPVVSEGLDTDDLEPVSIELVANVTSVAPGGQLVVATVFHMEPEWHIYWTNPGESGLATKADVTVPDGFDIGDVRYPGPMRFESPGPVVSYGYAGTAALSSIARVGDDAGAGPYEVSVSASWLACRDACIRGRGEASLIIENGPRTAASSAVLEEHEAALPRPFEQLGASAEWIGLELAIGIPDADSVEWFPTEDTESATQSVSAAPTNESTTLTIAFDRAPDAASGVIAVTHERVTIFYQLDEAPPAAPEP